MDAVARCSDRPADDPWLPPAALARVQLRDFDPDMWECAISSLGGKGNNLFRHLSRADKEVPGLSCSSAFSKCTNTFPNRQLASQAHGNPMKKPSLSLSQACGNSRAFG